MAANLRPLVRVGALLFLVLALILAGQPASVHAQPNSDGTVYVVQSGDRLVDIAARFGVSASAIVRANGLANADTIYPGQRLTIPGASAAPTSAPVVSPGASGAVSQPTTYTIQLGDTLASIARKFGLSVVALADANDIGNADLIWVGQKLSIPGAGGSSGGQVQPALTPTPIPVPLPAPAQVTTLPSAQPPPTAGSSPAAQPQATAQPTVQPTAQPSPTSKPAADPTANPAAAPAAPKIHVVQKGETLSTIAKRYGVSVEALVSANGLGSADLIGVGVRLLIPGKETTSAGGGAPAATIRPTKFVASISQQRCWLYNGETVIARWICSTGRRGAPSVAGSYKIQSKLPKAYGSTWNIWMPFWLGIYWAGASENGIHGLPWDAKTGVQIWSGNVGKPITFGCIMLDNVNAKMLYDMAWIGMPVIIRP